MKNTSKIIALIDEIEKIEYDEIREAVMSFIEKIVPDYFFEIPASSTGKFHPSFDQGTGGLIRHTQMTVAVALELLRLEEYDELTPKERDCVIASCILHDTFKDGYADNKSDHTLKNHADIAAHEWQKFALPDTTLDFLYVYLIYRGIKCHMVQWSVELKPLDKITQCVAMSDYIASRKFFDKFNEVD